MKHNITLNFSKEFIALLDTYQKEIDEIFNREQLNHDSRNSIIRGSMIHFLKQFNQFEFKNKSEGKIISIHEDPIILNTIDKIMNQRLIFSRSELYRMALFFLLLEADNLKRKNKLKKTDEDNNIINNNKNQDILEIKEKDNTVKKYKIVKNLK